MGNLAKKPERKEEENLEKSKERKKEYREERGGIEMEEERGEWKK